jgi:hypothetical protein
VLRVGDGSETEFDDGDHPASSWQEEKVWGCERVHGRAEASIRPESDDNDMHDERRARRGLLSVGEVVTRARVRRWRRWFGVDGGSLMFGLGPVGNDAVERPIPGTVSSDGAGQQASSRRMTRRAWSGLVRTRRRNRAKETRVSKEGDGSRRPCLHRAMTGDEFGLCRVLQ